MIEKRINDGWKFWIDHNAFALIWSTPHHAKEVRLPHDAMLETPAHSGSMNKTSTGYRDGDIYNYLYTLDIPKEYIDKIVKLKFEGIYMNAFVYVNGNLAGKCPYGYSTFYVELNEFLRYGEVNEIRVVVRNGAMGNSRWYSGGGIYRDVYLLVSELTHILEAGVSVTTIGLTEEDATLEVLTHLMNRQHTTQIVRLVTKVMDQEGKMVAFDDIPISLFGNEPRKFSMRCVINHPYPWSDETPYLYTCESQIVKEDEVIDSHCTTFGIRMLGLNAKNGLQVNGKTVKLRGACIHHDSGLLGAATYEDAQYRQIELLKEAGFNGIRMSHNPVSQPMLRACDELGMYIMDETFDMWTRCKSDYDYGMVFNEWWEKDIEAMVKKNYNHPSVILYSIGNEIPEIATYHGTRIAHRMVEKIKSLDSTRYTLASINGVFASGDVIDLVVKDVVKDLKSKGKIEGDVNNFMMLMEKHMDDIVIHPELTKNLEKACAVTDIAGYNYMAARYIQDGKDYPNRIIVGSETYPPEIPRNWELVTTLDHVIGDFTWTGWDYIGEAGVGVPGYSFGEGGFGANYPNQLAYCGDIDITGFRRPASYFREIVFGMRKEPYITVQNPYRYGQQVMKTPWILSDSLSSWSYDDCLGKPVIVEIYCSGDEVELFLNDKSLGMKKAGKAVGFITTFDITYLPGTLKARSYEQGKLIGTTQLSTATDQYQLVIEKEERRSHELIYMNIELRDNQQTLVTHRDDAITIVVEGGAELVGFGTGNPKPLDNYTSSQCRLFQGRAQAILKRKNTRDRISISIQSDYVSDEVSFL